MKERGRRSRELQKKIGRMLYEDWDPLGLRGVVPLDEYDGYIGGVYRLLASGASCEQVAEHLADWNAGRLAIPKPQPQYGGGQEVVRTRRSRLNGTEGTESRPRTAGMDRVGRSRHNSLPNLDAKRTNA